VRWYKSGELILGKLGQRVVRDEYKTFSIGVHSVVDEIWMSLLDKELAVIFSMKPS